MNIVHCHLDRHVDCKIVLRVCDKRVVPDMRQRESVANIAVAMDDRIVHPNTVDIVCVHRNAGDIVCVHRDDVDIVCVHQNVVDTACVRWTI